jgi:hypothetical protein
MSRFHLTRQDILEVSEFEQKRPTFQQKLLEIKKNRRVPVGPYATFYFESYDTIWWQIHEMLRIEKGGENQIEDELKAYASLVPSGGELVATLMFEIDSKPKRTAFLSSLGGVEETIALEFNGLKIQAFAEEDVDRTTVEGKTSAIHFLHFPMTDEQIKLFKSSENVLLSINHPQYTHMAGLLKETHKELCQDFKE